MHPQLRRDRDTLAQLLSAVAAHAARTFATQSTRAVAQSPRPLAPAHITADGIGADGAWRQFLEEVAPHLSASAGPRYLGFVTGGATPAAVIGDWLATTYDQNVVSRLDSSLALDLERTTLQMLGQLFTLPADFTGTFVSGATMSNMVGLAIGREWIGREQGVAIHRDGLTALPHAPTIFAATPHSTAVKALSMLGLGRSRWQPVPCLQGREAMDVRALESLLAAAAGPCLVIASAGTVNTGDVDDFRALAALKSRHRFYLHIDAAFGGFASLSPDLAPLLDGWTCADSICIDLHKWLNVPYDSAVAFTRHRDLQLDVFANSAAYLALSSDDPEPIHLAPESSHRWRALPAWFTLMAYGREGHREIVERDCRLARQLGDRLASDERFELLAPVRLNIVAFALRARPEQTAPFIARVRDSGDTFVSETRLWGRPAARAAFSNWQTTEEDVETVWRALVTAAETL